MKQTMPTCAALLPAEGSAVNPFEPEAYDVPDIRRADDLFDLFDLARRTLGPLYQFAYLAAVVAGATLRYDLGERRSADTSPLLAAEQDLERALTGPPRPPTAPWADIDCELAVSRSKPCRATHVVLDAAHPNYHHRWQQAGRGQRCAGVPGDADRSGADIVMSWRVSDAVAVSAVRDLRTPAAVAALVPDIAARAVAVAATEYVGWLCPVGSQAAAVDLVPVDRHWEFARRAAALRDRLAPIDPAALAAPFWPAAFTAAAACQQTTTARTTREVS